LTIVVITLIMKTGNSIGSGNDRENWVSEATAILLFHSKHGFFVPMGVEFVTLLLASAIALAIAGPGAYSVDQRGAAS